MLLERLVYQDQLVGLVLQAQQENEAQVANLVVLDLQEQLETQVLKVLEDQLVKEALLDHLVLQVLKEKLDQLVHLDLLDSLEKLVLLDPLASKDQEAKLVHLDKEEKQVNQELQVHKV